MSISKREKVTTGVMLLVLLVVVMWLIWIQEATWLATILGYGTLVYVVGRMMMGYKK